MPSPYDIDDEKKKLEEQRKRDEEVFRKHQELQKKQREEEHARTVKAKIADLERQRDHKQLALRAIEAEKPSLESRIRLAKRTEYQGTGSTVKDEERAVHDGTERVEHLKSTIDSLERELVDAKRDERAAEGDLHNHEQRLDEAKRAEQRTHSDAEADERAAHHRLEDKKREAAVLETEIRRMDDQVASLRRELH